MEFVAQLAERQVVALVVMGSIPIKLPLSFKAQWAVQHCPLFNSYLEFHRKGFFSSSIARKEAFISIYKAKCIHSFIMLFLLYKV